MERQENKKGGSASMVTISSTSSSNANRISGLASGLDTENLVKELTSTTKSRIEKAKQQKQIFEWKQADYQKISTALVNFNEKYFGTSVTGTLIGNALNRFKSNQFQCPIM